MALLTDKIFSLTIRFYFYPFKDCLWLPLAPVLPSVLHNIVLSACLPSLITGEVEVRMQQSEANRFSFGSGKDFPCQGYIHCSLAHPAQTVPHCNLTFFCQNIFTPNITLYITVLFCGCYQTTVMKEIKFWICSLT